MVESLSVAQTGQRHKARDTDGFGHVEAAPDPDNHALNY